MNKRVFAIVTAGFLTTFIAFAIRYSYGLVLPQMLSSLAISKTEAGVIFSAYFVTATIFSPFIGVLADRYDARTIIAAFVGIMGVGSCLMSLSTSVVQASIFFAIIGMGHSACWAPVVAVVMRWVSPERRGIAVSLVDLGTTAGIAVWSIAVPIIVAAHTWRTVWVSLGVSALIIAAANFFLVRSRPETLSGAREQKEAQKRAAPARGAYSVILRDRKFYLIAFSYLAVSFSILIPFTFLITYATQKLTVSYASAAALLIVIAVAGAIGKLILAYVSDRVGRIEIMMLCGLLTAVAPLGMAYGHGLSTLWVFSAIFGVGYGTLWSMYAASARDLFPGKYSGSIIGLWTLFHGLGSIAAPILAGRIIDVTGSYNGAFILAAAGSVLSLLLLLPVRGYERKNRKDRWTTDDRPCGTRTTDEKAL